MDITITIAQTQRVNSTSENYMFRVNKCVVDYTIYTVVCYTVEEGFAKRGYHTKRVKRYNCCYVYREVTSQELLIEKYLLEGTQL